MSILGKAALAMWWDMSISNRSEFEDWHTHEHFPERLGVHGFRRASRWMGADGSEGVFVMYELADHEVLGSAAYAARLNSPTPWSTKLMPEHRNMVRSQCRVLESAGFVTTRYALTIRVSPSTGGLDPLRAAIGRLADDVPRRRGLAGLHMLRHETPPIAPTTEQRIRGNADQTADCVVIATGYELELLQTLSDGELGEQSLVRMGAASGPVRGLYSLSCSATPGDIA